MVFYHRNIKEMKIHPQIAKIILGGERLTVRGIIVDFTIYYRALVPKPAWYETKTII